MQKKWIFGFLLFSSIVLAHFLYQKYRTPKYTLSQQVRPDTTIFAFDLHNVVLDTDITQVIRLLWQDFFRYAPLSLLVNPKTWYHLYQFSQDHVSAEYFFQQLAQNHPKAVPFKKLFSDLISAQDLNYKTIGLIFALKFYGYKIYILSNIWPESLYQLYRKYPVLKDLFDGAYIPSDKNHYLAKPHPSFYLGFQEYLVDQLGKNNKQIILIDNSRENIKVARSMNLHAIEFHSVNNLIKFLTKEQVISAPSLTSY